MVVHLDESPPYYALSHCWGKQVQNTNIVIGGTSIPILTELYVAIQRLRALAATTVDHPALDPPLEYVWIDSICINQHDAQERSTQVQLMGAIYLTAIRTLIWLGPEFDSSFAAWKMIDDIYDIFHAETPMAQTLEDIPQCMYSDAIHAKFELPPWDSPRWSYLKQLLDLRWFSRVWVIQEVVNSRRDPIIIHGQTLHSWHRLGWAAAWLRRKGYTRLPQVSKTILNVDMLCILRGSRVAWPLDALLSATQVKFHATDQRDKVWSLLGLAAECCSDRERETRIVRSTGSIPYELRPDYTLSTTQVYQRVSRYLLTHNHTLALLTRTRGPIGSLSRTRRTTELPDLPSWVPDYSDFVGYNRHIRTSFSWVHYAPDKQQQPATLGYPKNYAAAAQTRLKIYDEEKVSGADDYRTCGVAEYKPHV
ncbi:heterokaryon incompatibility protein-domain-containing protein [Xylariaceae sp. FL1651]|nr:heterokaryon incompatibility protein-domain-containing protein [Xylariaceae sp. FL1651]